MRAPLVLLTTRPTELRYAMAMRAMLVATLPRCDAVLVECANRDYAMVYVSGHCIRKAVVAMVAFTSGRDFQRQQSRQEELQCRKPIM